MILPILSLFFACGNCPDGSTELDDGRCVNACDDGFALNDEGVCIPALGECDETVRVTGTFEMDGNQFDIDETQGSGLRFAIEHKIDIDKFEAGCIDDIALKIEQASLGCTIDLDFRSNGDGSFRLNDFEFKADSYCPNFPDAIEGSYSMLHSFLVVDGLPAQIAMTSGIEEEVCVPDLSLSFGASGDLSLNGGSVVRPFTLNLNLSGDTISAGSTNASCEVTGNQDNGATCSGNFEIDSTDPQSAIAQLGACNTISGDLSIVDVDLEDLDGLENLSKVGGSLTIKRTKLVQIDGLRNLKSVGGFIDINNNPLLRDITALHGLESVGGDIYIENNGALCLSAAQSFVTVMESWGWNGTETIAGNSDC